MSGVYMAIGDSMSIDDYAGGPGRGAASLLYHNRDDDFPDWAGRDLRTAGLAPHVLAVDAATAGSVLAGQLPLVSRPPTVVTVTMGGNDLLLAYGDAGRATATIREVVAWGELIMGRLSAIGEPDCRVVLTTVYDPSDGTGRIGTSGLAPWPEGPELVRALNAELSGLAERHGAVVADVHGRFLGHGTTAGDISRPEPRPDDPDVWLCGDIEPNAWGAHQIRCAWWDALVGSGWQPPS